MSTAVLKRTVQLLRASVLGQLQVLCAAALLLAFVAVAGSVVGVVLVGSLAAVLAIATSARTAVRHAAGYETTPADIPDDLLRLAPRVAAQSAFVVVPATIAWWCAMQAASAASVVGLVVLPTVLLASLAVLPVLLLVAAAIASGDRSWHPARALQVFRRNPRGIVAVAVAGLVGASFMTLPLSAFALVLGTIAGPAGIVAWGLAAASVVPLLGCGAIAAWEVLGGSDVLREHAEADDLEAGAGALHAAFGWSEGPTWDVAIDAGGSWGTWLRLSTAADAALRVTWHAGPAPELAIADQDGAWRHPGDPARSGDAVALQLPAGDTYVQLASRSPDHAQAVSVTLLVPAAQAA